MKKAIGLIGTAAALFSCGGIIPDNAEMYLLVGSYSSPVEKGIHVLSFDEENGESHLVSGINGIANPSYLVPADNGKYVYCVSETNDETASLFAYSFNKDDGSLKYIDDKPTKGTSPCYVWMDSSRQLAVTANYNGGSISVFPIAPDGSLQDATVIEYAGGKPGSKRQSQPHLHCVYPSPDGKYVYANDLGTDRIYKYNAEVMNGNAALEKGSPAYFQLPDGEGPRHTEFHPNGRFAYVIGELSGNITALKWKNNGDLEPIQTISADSLHAAGSADIHLSPDGKYLYASNRLKGDGIAIFKVDSSNGMIKKIGYQPTGIHPRNFAISPNGKYLLCACRDDNKIQIFQIDPSSGTLVKMDKEIKLHQPVCLKFVKK